MGIIQRMRVLVAVVVMAMLAVLGQSAWPPQTNAELRAAVTACIAISSDGNCPTYQCVTSPAAEPPRAHPTTMLTELPLIHVLN